MKQSHRLMLYVVLILALTASFVAAQDATEAPAEQPASRTLLVWAVDGAAGPGLQGASTPGQLALLDANGGLTPLLDLPQGTSTVIPCGENSTSPDGRYVAFYVGGDEGTLHYMRGTEPPVLVDEVIRSACLGAGTFRFSPDGNQFGFIDYEPGAAASSFADGFLKIYDAASGEALYQTESVTAFDMGGGIAAFVNFFTNDQGEADEVAVQVWDGANDREVATLRPDDTEDTGQCRFVSASVNVLPDGQLSLILGQRCDRTGTTTWQLYTVNPADRTATRAASEPVVGGYQAFARTNTQFVAPGGNAFLFTVPDGVTANTAGLYLTPLDTLTPSVVVDQQIVMPAVTTPANATPDVSPDGRWLALVQTTPNNENTLLVYDLTDLNLAPLSYSAGSAGDVISAMQFTPDGSRLIAVVGGDDQANNSIVAFNMADGSDFRVERGRFNDYLALSQDGTQLAIGNWQILEDPNEPPYLNTITIDINASASTTLYEGAVVQDGEVIEQSFAAPLAFR